MSKDKVTIAQ